MNLTWEALLAFVAFALTLWFVLAPEPYSMVVFTFLAQPLFLIVAAFYLIKVARDLRRRDVL
jgi:hypothetical protein